MYKIYNCTSGLTPVNNDKVCFTITENDSKSSSFSIDDSRSETFPKFGGSTSFGFAKEPVKMADGIETQANPTSETEYFVLSSIRAAIPRRYSLR